MQIATGQDGSCRILRVPLGTSTRCLDHRGRKARALPEGLFFWRLSGSESWHGLHGLHSMKHRPAYTRQRAARRVSERPHKTAGQVVRQTSHRPTRCLFGALDRLTYGEVTGNSRLGGGR